MREKDYVLASDLATARAALVLLREIGSPSRELAAAVGNLVALIEKGYRRIGDLEVDP